MSDPIWDAAQAARSAAIELSQTSETERNTALESIKKTLRANSDKLLEANKRDLADAEKGLSRGELTSALVKRLELNSDKLDNEILFGVKSVVEQADPLGKTLSSTELDEKLTLFKISVPIGVIGVIFESRPDALVQIASLCLKSGNAVLLKGGSEALQTNRVISDLMLEATQGLPGIPEGWMYLLEAREDVRTILALDHLIDLIIPRGSNELVQYIMENTKIPVMGHADGICHVYVDAAADLEMAKRICLDSKTQYPSVCNAAETFLIHQEIVRTFLPEMIELLITAGVEVRGDLPTRKLSCCKVVPVTEEDWGTEYLDMVVSVKVVKNQKEAIDHIDRYGSHHTDAIVTEDGEAALQFLNTVDSASVLHNVSTRLADGFRYGLGAEVGISTNRIHSRGPVGLEGLVIYKYILEGKGQIVSEYLGGNARIFLHRKLKKEWKRDEG